MIGSIGLILILGLLGGLIVSKARLPNLLGYLIVGIIIGPNALNLIDVSVTDISPKLRTMILIIILIRAGLGINKKEILKVGKPAILLSFVPGVCEGLTIAFLSTIFLDFTFVQGGILGFILAAVSPAVVVPSMLKFMEKGKGGSITTLILAGASIDDVVAITIFSSFLGMYGGAGFNIGSILSIPIGIILGALIGAILGIVIVKIMIMLKLDNMQAVFFILGSAFLLNEFGDFIKSYIEIATLLGIMAMAFIISSKKNTTAIRATLGNIWKMGEIFLFVLVGAEVNVPVAINAGIVGVLIICIGLIFRSIGVYFSVISTKLTRQEKIFCMIAYTPKATVQAAIGGIPLSMDVAGGEIILAIAVLSILITAPCGAVAIDIAGKKYLY
ncbi:potassium transporter [Candidatus Epulonipiscium fishelsonii]|uniref:Potassium transporter n=1 Tax=Candidatus Epulonipiscium fishelsonii TaxID=77094 RepID=A0ACC8XFK1_9FIRM|nr:potassium transporter [Epulopiscium sp. SCG-B11WGA-EpuloA1]ONI42860.1 potassium transporter [Epulopiscium sp. SCG-B05WGA-EpuloA1]